MFIDKVLRDDNLAFMKFLDLLNLSNEPYLVARGGC